MNHSFRVLALSALLIACKPAEAPAPADPCAPETFGGHRYAYCSAEGAQKSWADADAYCKSKGGYLATIESEPENKFLASRMAGGWAWLGLNDQTTEGTFVWAHGEKTTYTNWCPGEPNDSAGAEDCGVMVGGGCWNDGKCGSTGAFFCEWD